MMTSFIITFRETLEAALIVGIVLSYLVRTQQPHYKKSVYAGTLAGIAASLLGAFLFTLLAGGFEGRAEEIFEGVTMLIGAGLLTTMILWMMRQKNITQDLEKKVAAEISSSAQGWGLFFLVFVAILREGIETVIFLGSASFVSSGNTAVGAVIGIVVAIVCGYGIFLGSLKMNLKKFFTVTSVLLILFAAGLVAHGVHELQEAGVFPVIVEHVWDMNPAVYADGSFPLLHENGAIGSVLKGLFGYNGNPNLLEVLSYVTYIIVVAVVWRHVANGRNRQQQERKDSLQYA
jgi:high-affinity iron transporter